MTDTLTLDALVEDVARAICAAMGGMPYDERPAGERMFLKNAARLCLAAVAKAAGGVLALNASALILLDGVDSDHSKIVADHIATLLRTLAEAAP